MVKLEITEVAKQYDIPTDTLRRWERIGLIPPVTKTASGLRNYTAADLSWVRYTKTLLAAHLPEDFLIEYVTLAQLGAKAKPARSAFLKAQLAEIQTTCTQLTTIMTDMETSLDKTNGV